MDVEEGEAKTCRLCGQNERFYVDVFGEEGVRRYLSLRIHRNINILIKTDDSMPQQICRLCLEKLNFTCAFYDNCHEIQKKFIWSTIEEANDENNVEDKENTISSRNGIKRQIRTLSENLRKEINLINTDSLIIDASPKNQSCGNRFRRSCLREICSNAQTATNLWTQEEPVGMQKNKRGGLAQKETAGFEKMMKETNLKKECLLSENLSSRILPPLLLNNSTEWIHSLDWSLRLSREADKPRNVTNVAVNNSPPPGDEAELNRSSSFEFSNLTVPDNIGRSPLIVPKKACPLELNTISSQNNKSTALSGSSIISGCKEKRKHSKISELITNEQKQIIETYYLVDMDIMNKYAKEVRSNITMRDKNNIECNLCAAKYSRLDKCQRLFVKKLGQIFEIPSEEL